MPVPRTTLFALLTLLLCAMFAAPAARAQFPGPLNNDTQTPTPGSGHDYLNILDDTVNPANGSLSLRISVPVPPSRGLSLPFSFDYDSGGVASVQFSVNGNGTGVVGWYPPSPPGNDPFYSTGWSFSIPQVSTNYQQFQCTYSGGGPPSYFNANVWNDYLFTDPHGSRHTLGVFATDAPTTGPSYICPFQPENEPFNILSSGDDFVSAALSGPDAYDDSLAVADADGTVYHFPAPDKGTFGVSGTIPDYIEDRNGNKVTLSSGSGGSFTLTDTLGRQAVSSTGFGLPPGASSGSNNVSVSGLNNANGYAYKVQWESVSGSYPSTSLSVASGSKNGSADCQQISGGVGGTVVQSITLPNGTQYTFQYDPTTGLLSQITYPTGAIVVYTWGFISTWTGYANFPDPVQPGAGCPTNYTSPMVTKRTVKADGAHTSLVQIFGYTTAYNTGVSQATVTTTVYSEDDLHTIGTFQTTYSYSSILPRTYAEYDYSIPPNAPVERTVTYGGYNNSTLRTVTKGWTDQYEMGCQLNTLDNGLISGEFDQYGAGAVLTDKKEYDYGQISTSACPAAPASPSAPSSPAPARETVAQYAPLTNALGFPIDDRPSSIQVVCSPSVSALSCPAAGTQVSYLSFLYDQFGNATSKSVWLNVNDGPAPPPTTYTYDNNGQELSMTDPKGNVTSYCYGYTPGCPNDGSDAYLTQVTYPSTGGVQHIVKYGYNSSSGELTSSTDENGQVTSYQYNDPLARLTQTDSPDGGETTISYVEATQYPPNPPSVTTQTLLATGDWANPSTATLDGAGHVVKVIGENGAETDTLLDGEGRVYQQSNPYFTTSDPTYGTTTHLYDALGRPCLLIPPGGAAATSCPTSAPSGDLYTSYSGNSSTTTDGNGAVTTTLTDALGPIEQVTDALGNNTSYTHDALGNLTGVTEGAQTRSFSYDSLSRLYSQTMPESGTSSSTYDADGNVVTSTDARLITTTYSYDADNRLTGKTHSDNSPNTPPATFTYDQASVTIGSWTSGTLTNPIGRLVEATTTVSGAVQTADVYGYDQMGRTAYTGECVASQCGNTPYTVAYLYNLAGSPTQVWPQGPTHNAKITYSYDYTGQLSNVSSSLSDAQHPATLFSNAQYSPLGSLQQATLGTTVPLYANYDNHGWLTGSGAGAGAVLGSAGSGSVSIGGAPQDQYINTCPNSYYTCYENVPVTGTVSVTVNGVTSTVSYDDTSTTAQLAQSLAWEINSNLVLANSIGSTIYITARTDGSQTDYTLSAAQTVDPPAGQSAFWASASGSSLTGGASSANGTGAYNFILTHDPVGNVIAANDTTNGNWSYGHYDPLNRLVSSSCTSHCPDGANTQGFSYVYDRYGNRQQQNVTAGSGPQPQYSFSASTNHVTNNGYQYDLAGDVLNDGYCSYTWDAEQHMSSATCPSNNTVTTTYVYDAQGRRVAKEVSGAVTEADVYNTAGQVLSRYGPYPAETWLGDDVWVGGAHLAIYANGQTYFPLTDQVGTERARFASTGGIVESCVSLPFGDALQCTGSDSDPYHFGKLERDAETGDDHAQHRDYNSIPGHWLSPDPAGVKVVSLTDPQTWNLYVYSDNNPVTDNDPSGLQDCTHDGPCYEHPCDSSTGIGCNNPNASDLAADVGYFDAAEGNAPGIVASHLVRTPKGVNCPDPGVICEDQGKAMRVGDYNGEIFCNADGCFIWHGDGKGNGSWASVTATDGKLVCSSEGGTPCMIWDATNKKWGKQMTASQCNQMNKAFAALNVGTSLVAWLLGSLGTPELRAVGGSLGGGASTTAQGGTQYGISHSLCGGPGFNLQPNGN